MKKQKIILSFLSFVFIYLCISGYSNGIKDHTTNCSSCHGLASGKTFCSIELTEKSTGMEISDKRYKPNTVYYLTIKGYNLDSNSKFGYRLVITNKDTTKAGLLSSVDTAFNFIEHKSNLILATHHKIHNSSKPGIFTVPFEWKSPGGGSKSMNFHIVMNSVNADNSSSGDFLSEEIVEKYDEIFEAKISEKENRKLIFSPNPCTNVLHIETANNDNFLATIYDLAGRQVIAASQQSNIDVSPLTAGAYLLRLYKEDVQQTAIFVKQ